VQQDLLTLRRSNRVRGPYCPHHRTSDHDGSSCLDYLEYLATRTRGASRNVRDTHQEAHMLETSADQRTTARRAAHSRGRAPNTLSRRTPPSDEEDYGD
jgi:hypothetical protein